MQRVLSGRRARVLYFHDPVDPYSHLTAQALLRLIPAYAVDWVPYLVGPPEASAAPDATRLWHYGLRDAARLAQAHGLSFPTGPRPDGAYPLPAFAGTLATLKDAQAFAQCACDEGLRLWSEGLRAALDPSAADTLTAEGNGVRRRLGHYLGGTFWFEGEWFWGVDRLPYLEQRLAFARRGAAPVFQFLSEPQAPVAHNRPGRLEFFLSFRSPYTYIAAARAAALAERLGVELVRRPVLPMVMRGLPVPLAKRLYILRDTKREAQRWGLPFGDVCDPVGKGVERAMAVWHYAEAQGHGQTCVESVLRGVFAEGLDAASDQGLRRMAERAHVPWEQAEAALGRDAWRAEVERNRQAMFDAGLWGVPSFRLNGGAAHWGQDRLWAIAQDHLGFQAALTTQQGATR